LLDEQWNDLISFNVIRIIFGRRGAVMSGFLWTDILNCVLNDLTEDGVAGHMELCMSCRINCSFDHKVTSRCL